MGKINIIAQESRSMHLKSYFLALSLCLPFWGISQLSSPQSVNVSYFGEFITHPGLRLGLQYELGSKTRPHPTKSKETCHTIALRPSLGLFFHRRHQTGIFLLPEVGYLRTNQKRRQFGAGLGIGYLMSFIPNVFEVNPEGGVEPTLAAHHFVLASTYVRFGRQFKESPWGYFIQPQFIYALPNYPNGVAYLALELGITYKLNFNKDE